MVENVIQSKNGIMINVNVSVKKNKAWISNICACECDKDCHIDE